MSLLVSWLILAVAVWLTAMVYPPMQVPRFRDAIVVAAIFGVINMLIGWILFILIGVGTLGLGFLLAFLTRWVVNAIVLKMTDELTDRLTIDTFGNTMIAALIMSAIGSVGEWLLLGHG